MDALPHPELVRSVRAQAALRLKFGMFVIVVMLAAIYYWGPARPQNQPWEIGGFCAAYLLYNLTAYYLAHRDRLVSPNAMVVATAVLDPLMLSAWLFVGGESSVLFIGFYLFTILGFGFRIGPVAMQLSQAMSIAGFGLVAATSPAWRDHPLFEISHLVLLVVVPLYAGVLIRNLQLARAMAERASQAKSQLLANVSHELRTPLTGIVSTASLIEAQSPDADSVGRAHAIIDMALALDLEIKQLLDLSRIEAGRDDGQKVAFELAAVGDHITRTLGPVAAAKDIVLAVELDPAIGVPVLGDAHALGSALMNLVGNAVKFTDAGSVTLDAKLLDQDEETCTIRFQVRDTGIGIPPEMQQKIFEPFVQVESGPARKYGGTGLGTSIALAHVRRMGGELRLESTMGKGSRFWFDLRLPRARTPAPAGAEAAVRVVRGKHVLVADDNATNLTLIREMLERDSHEVLAVASGQEALEALARDDFELVFLDFNMHDVDGATVYETYRFGRLRPAPTFFITADTSALTTARLEALGAAGIIHKPVTFARLRNAIASQFPDSAAMPLAPLAPVAPRPAPHLRPVPVEYLDPAAIDTLREVRDTPEFLCRMIGDGAQDIERIDQALGNALLARDLTAVHRQAHALRGVSLSLGAARLAALADRLMSIGQRELEANARERHADLRRTTDLSLAALDALRQSLQAPDAASG
ncbi:MAG: ATP-binding protein [Pseudomonadota bacterium]|nr:ATP-binding protein [Pseudomonadota bacterium]